MQNSEFLLVISFHCLSIVTERRNSVGFCAIHCSPYELYFLFRCDTKLFLRLH